METATRVLEAVEEGRLKNVQLSSEVLHELYYVFSDYVPLTTVYSIDRSRGCFEKPEGKNQGSKRQDRP